MSIRVTNLRQLDADLDRIAESLGIPVVLVQKKLAFDIFADIVADTPVDTGRAMNNWNMSISIPDASITDRGGDAVTVQSVKSIQAAQNLAALRPFSTVWISNSLPYIGFLNEGSSDQAPRNFVEKNVLNNLASIQVLL